MPDDPSEKPKPPTPLALKIGYGLWAISLLWWFLYYAQYSGAFDMLDLKLACITGATSECLFFQQQMANTGILPTYVPIFWYAGLVAMLIGLYQSYQARKAAS
jgi:hypothetical protein